MTLKLSSEDDSYLCPPCIKSSFILSPLSSPSESETSS